MQTHRTRKPQQNQQKRIQHHARNSDAYRFFNLLTSPALLANVEALLPGHRERLFPPTETLSMFLAQALSSDRSCQKVVNDAAVKRMTGGLPMCSTRTGAYCRARQRLDLKMVSTLVCQSAQLMDNAVPKQWHWRGRPVRLFDGTTVAMSDTAANQAVYPQQNAQQAGLGFPICRLLGIICLSSGAVLNAAVGPYHGKGSTEQDLLRGLLDTFTYAACPIFSFLK